MACLFGHKWNGCKCTKCGATRDEEHKWDGCACRVCGKIEISRHKFIHVNGKDEEQCTVCGEKREMPHNINNGTCLLCGKSETELSEQLTNEVKNLAGNKEFVSSIKMLSRKYCGIKDIEKIMLPACKMYGESFYDMLEFMRNIILNESGIRAGSTSDIMGLIYEFMLRLQGNALNNSSIPVAERMNTPRIFLISDKKPRLLSSWNVEKCLAKMDKVFSGKGTLQIADQCQFFPNQTDCMPLIEAMTDSLTTGDNQPVFDLQTGYAVKWLGSSKEIPIKL